MTTRTIDLDTWPRKAAWDWYRRYADPTFDLVAQVTAPGLLQRCKAGGRSPFGVVLHALGGAVQDTEPFRTRLRGDTVVVHDVVHPGFVVLADDRSIRFCGARWDPDLDGFLAGLQAASAAAKAAPLRPASDGDDVFFVTSMPWLDLRSVRHARTGDPDQDAIPRFAWGRLGPEGFALSVSVHHALVDGSHVGELIAALERRLGALGR